MGILYIVATPIGNLKDITLRALEVLREADLIVCEDTRVTSKLLNHYGISKPLVSYFQHSKFSKLEYIVDQLRESKKIALVTDAGTPGISDPGNLLIKHVTCNMKHGGGEIKIVPIPGASAATIALSISGFPTDKFIFLGFPPQKKGREKFFKEIAGAKHTAVFYESVHRIIKALEQLKEVLSADRKIVVCRELTKQFETIYRGAASEVLEAVKNDKIKGEFVVIINHE
ncbi:MAG: 16S rRNA (cytidine(1402)-2'-O)-methyltransferase [Candidatus Portnoybacteria bacterium CG_4_8_14_3_um_filter_44_10]|uniref:Ribosomal RNA small subunit methyltransferase I n=5 Tax=Candidatus Portnoyibacteriota TaxID=1817913 RepID=A0A2H0KPE4_9BACT|nr:MAG: 16S rRNA (cytidine(1402)-2'-O)-methyltransferase [Candidatus Portnoybacteria bacterium CG11_big_fil_rev_8_21_14_0_20_44_10]PIS16574.1 MAG: 16S rRNA (cytidine(1402)-2'-O)-methyltransferase [Candidatus Portnoybacteria bacterium CG09_land_8_20_14_0_10_44_13]PIW75759.1 MAG: 16S rRNA (cytidine(1402)-2'-O)-methyltransferase [Candidatus Portnoybacteria bacterium CG_4_8_14_3_um_filter_44_10]PIZ71109.1 MAG: 16S rRNA (cytidine(1402)-2'-O)-methyltransferase [Candidatus Portnoybacteria bacterium CG_